MRTGRCQLLTRFNRQSQEGKTKAECLEFVEGIYRTGIQGTRDVLGVKK